MPRIPISIALAVTAAATTLSAQAPAPATGGYDTRARLEASAVAAENAGRTAEAGLLRSRLTRGDFQEGDRIVVVLEAAAVTSDTMQVRAGKILPFAQMGEVSLEGVLRSELNDKLREHLSKYLTHPTVHATPLLPLAVVGSVRNPGFVYAPADYLLRDLLMRAGGPAPDGNVGGTVVKRDGKIIWTQNDVRSAFANGLSLDRLHLRAGDEVYVPQQRGRLSMALLLSIATTAAAVVVAADH